MLIVQKHLSPRRGKRAIQEGDEAVEQELWTILFDPECKDGLATVLGNVRRNAEAVRERLSYDTFRDPARPNRDHLFVAVQPEVRNRRCAAAAESADPVFGRVQWHGHGEHDARLWLALPRDGPAPRAAACRDPAGPAADCPRRPRKRRRARAPARARRQHDDLSRPLSGDAAAVGRARPAACPTTATRARPCFRS